MRRANLTGNHHSCGRHGRRRGASPSGASAREPTTQHRHARAVWVCHLVRSASRESPLGRHDGGGGRSRRQERLGVRALRRRQLCELEPAADSAFRSVGQAAGEFRRRHVRVSARDHGRPRGQRLGRRRRRQERQGPPGREVQPDRQGADDLGQGGNAGRRAGYFNRPSGVASRATATSSSPTAMAETPTRAS